MPKLIKMKVIPMADQPVHTLPEHPFCQDMTCGCHDDVELITEPWQNGHLTEREAERLFQGE